MKGKKQNHYGKLCTEMYEILHDRTALEELEFYLSYADKDKKILEPLCGSGRFLLPFMEQELCITAVSYTHLDVYKRQAMCCAG